MITSHWDLRVTVHGLENRWNEHGERFQAISKPAVFQVEKKKSFAQLHTSEICF